MSLTGSRVARSIVFAAVLTATQAEAICSQGFRLAGNDVAYLYTGAYIDSLGYADQARQRMSAGLASLQKKQSTPSDMYSATIDALAALELGAKDFECAASLIASQKRLPVDPTNDVSKGATETARESAVLTEMEYLQLAKLMREYSGIMQAGLGGTLPMAERAKVAALIAKIQESWGYVLHAVQPTKLLLLDPEPDTSGHMSRLRITGQQRDSLLKSIDQRFGSRVRGKLDENTPVPELAAGELREFLTNKGYTLRK